MCIHVMCAADEVVQLFMNMMVSGKEDDKPLIPDEVEKQFVLWLLNPSTTKFRSSHWKQGRKSDYYKHLMLNCPKMKKFAFDKDMWVDVSSIEGASVTRFFLDMSSHWTSLASVDFSSGVVFSNLCLKLVSTHLPNLV